MNLLTRSARSLTLGPLAQTRLLPRLLRATVHQLSHTRDSRTLAQVLQEVLDTNRRPGPFDSSASGSIFRLGEVLAV